MDAVLIGGSTESVEGSWPLLAAVFVVRREDSDSLVTAL
jgi:hypothetical protein